MIYSEHYELVPGEAKLRLKCRRCEKIVSPHWGQAVKHAATCSGTHAQDRDPESQSG